MIKKYILYTTLIATSFWYLLFAIKDFCLTSEIIIDKINSKSTISRYSMSETLDKFPEKIVTQDKLRQWENLRYLWPLLSIWKDIEGVSLGEKNRIHGDIRKNGVSIFWISLEDRCVDGIIGFEKSIRNWDRALLYFWENECLLTNEDFWTLHKLKYEYFKSTGIKVLVSEYKLVKFWGAHDEMQDYYDKIVLPIIWSFVYSLTSLIYLILSIKWTYHMWVNKNWKKPIK